MELGDQGRQTRVELQQEHAARGVNDHRSDDKFPVVSGTADPLS